MPTRRTARPPARKPAAQRPAAAPAWPARGRLLLLVGTTKGLFALRSDRARRRFRLEGPYFLGHVVQHAVLDPRDRKTLLVAASTGHLGPTVFRSQDLGRKWQEAAVPPRFERSASGDGRAVKSVFWLEAGHPSEPGVWYAGTSPHGLFRSEDAGRTWAGVKGFNDNPMLATWSGGADNPGSPVGPLTHSILIDPRDPRRMYVGMSAGGVFTSDDQGASWRPLNQGVLADFQPDKYPAYGQDTHRARLHPFRPDRLWQQNHCGIYRLDRPEERWTRVGEKMPRDIGDIGFGIVLHPRDVDTAWVFPMDGSTVWPRVSPGGKPSVYVTRDAGRSWRRLDRGLPRAQAWFTVKRQAFTGDGFAPVGLYFGTSSGEVWMSRNEGASWRQVAAHLPHIYSLETACL